MMTRARVVTGPRQVESVAATDTAAKQPTQPQPVPRLSAAFDTCCYPCGTMAAPYTCRNVAQAAAHPRPRPRRPATPPAAGFPPISRPPKATVPCPRASMQQLTGATRSLSLRMVDDWLLLTWSWVAGFVAVQPGLASPVYVRMKGSQVKQVGRCRCRSRQEQHPSVMKTTSDPRRFSPTIRVSDSRRWVEAGSTAACNTGPPSDAQTPGGSAQARAVKVLLCRQEAWHLNARTREPTTWCSLHFEFHTIPFTRRARLFSLI